MKRFAVVTLLFLFLSITNLSAQTPPSWTNAVNGNQYYVNSAIGNDSNDGSQAHPWKTLSRADQGVVPGSTIHVACGVYPNTLEDSGRLLTTTSGTLSAPIRWVSDVRWGAKLTTNLTGNDATWWNQGNYVEIQGFEITGSGALGIYNEGSFTRIIDNKVHDIPATGCPSDGGAGIHDGNYAASDDDIIGNWVYHIGNYTSPCPRVHGIYHANLRGHIYNNVVSQNEGWGIHTWHAATHVTITNNTVFSNAYGGILIGAAKRDFRRRPGNTSNDWSTISNNIVYDNGNVAGGNGYGTEEYGSVGYNNQYFNNLVYQNGPADWNLMHSRATGTIAADPGFNRYQRDGSGDYHLLSTSRATTTGSPVSAPTYDFEYGPRPVNGTWSIGAYQYGTAAGTYPQP